MQHVARGPPRGCDAALRPRGRAAGGPRGAQEAHGAATWRRAMRQREHMWAPVWGATCKVGKREVVTTVNRGIHSPI